MTDSDNFVGPASTSVLAALLHIPTIAEALFLDPEEGRVPDERTLAWFDRCGVPIDAVASPIAIRTQRVGFDRSGRYAPNVVGDFALILPVVDWNGVVDFCAWVPRTGKIGTRLGIGAMLGGELIGRDTGDGVTVPPLHIFRSPLDWLRARRRGAVILNRGKAALALVGVVVEADASYANELRHLRAPGPIVRIGRTEELAA